MRHLRRSGKKISSRKKTASEGDVIEGKMKPEPRESFRLKMSAIQADLRNFSPMRSCRIKGQSGRSKRGSENKGFEEQENQHNNDMSQLSTFR